MNATVSKLGKKSASGKAGGAGSANLESQATAKSPVKIALKTVADSLVNTIKGVLKPVSEGAPVTKDAAKPLPRASREGASKASDKPAAKGARVTTRSDAPEHSPSVAKTAQRAQAPIAASVGSVGLEDKIETVLKVSEVGTKTSKSTTAVPADGTLLTEAQILKMSDTDYMNAAQLAFFKDRLQNLEKELLKNAGETTEHLRETVLVPDPADRATIEEEHALELRTRDRERKLLKKVQQSIAAIDSGEYGWCEETGEPIGIARLMARPTATLSLEAQQRRELKQKLYGD